LQTVFVVEDGEFFFAFVEEGLVCLAVVLLGLLDYAVVRFCAESGFFGDEVGVGMMFSDEVLVAPWPSMFFVSPQFAVSEVPLNCFLDAFLKGCFWFPV
jgi:hypothetical protein